MVLHSINMLMLAETGEGILSAVEFLFKNLKKMEGDMVDEIQKKN